MFSSIVEEPLHSLNDFFDSAKFELFEVDLISLLKALDLSGNWERALLLFEWILSNLSSENLKLNNPMIELMVRILGRESQHTIASKLFDVIPIEKYSLDVRAYTTIIHAHSRTGKYERAIDLFNKMVEIGLSPTLVTYNVMLDVYGKMGRSWYKILGLLEEMRSKGFEFDEFTCSTVISACGREGLLNEAKEFFAGLKSQGYVPGTVTYNALLQVFGKAGVFTEALSILKEMEDNNCPPDAVTYNELVAAYVRAGFSEEGASVLETMTQKGTMPNAVTYTTVINAYGKAGKEEEALRLFNHMKATGCVPNVCTYNAVLGMLGKKSRPEEMIMLLCDMKASGCAPTVLPGTQCLPCVVIRVGTSM
ncbi:pentatricopeptide repeat-containing protein [Prunus yedoensis var. nudiflora]|uniref:Pentatricopeptide repeat-containing protein n=1 Tax=Prunus yedoensis var. nudiflora TaxID=2094558 RepID=A0A314UVA6_PRUYE|nr:pentatricopeptide repeat-containing protein [Prunus yedoensis var. nudiflora]